MLQLEACARREHRVLPVTCGVSGQRAAARRWRPGPLLRGRSSSTSSSSMAVCRRRCTAWRCSYIAVGGTRLEGHRLHLELRNMSRRQAEQGEALTGGGGTLLLSLLRPLHCTNKTSGAHSVREFIHKPTNSLQ